MNRLSSWTSLPRPSLPLSYRKKKKVLRIRVQPLDGQERWVELEEMELDLLELAERSLSLPELMEEVVEERLSRREDGEDDDDDDELYVDGETDHDDGDGGVGGLDLDEEELEGLAVDAANADVLEALRSLYQKRLIAFEEEED